MRIKRSEDGLILSLNKDLYKKDAVDSATKDFSRACTISCSEGKGRHIVHFSGLETRDLEEIVLEFANYVLSVMKTVK